MLGMTMKNGIRAVLFDMDETLLEHTCTFEELGHKAYSVFEDRLAPVTREEFWETFWEKALDLWQMMFDGVLPGAVARRYGFINTLRTLKVDENLADEMLRVTDGLILESTRLFSETPSVLETLRKAGFTLGIVTNGYTELQRLKLNHHGLCGLVDFTIVSEEAGAHKPDPRIFEIALTHAKSPAAACLFVGDMLDTDIKGARNAGMKSVLIDIGGKWDGLRTKPEGVEANWTIKRLSELLPLLGLESRA
jgi:HAD superfamily hydrolase (TIGR01549 family)